MDKRHASRQTPSLSPRDVRAADRDRAASDRDRAAGSRDEQVGAGRPLSASERTLAARDREAAASDREAAAADRAAAREELAIEGTDALTGVMGRRAGLAALQREIDRAGRTGQPLVVAFVDAVGLKAANDTHGHHEGDRILREVADCISEDLRSYDVVTRVGGDEFVCALSGELILDAGRRFEQISARLAERGNGASITVGLAAHEAGDSLDALVDRADQAMIAARRRE